MVDAPPDTPCAVLVDPDWEGTCGIEEMAGGRAIWVVQHQTVPESCCWAWVVRVFVYSADAGGWYPALEAADLTGTVWSSASVVTEDLTGNGTPEIVAGIRFQGSAETLGYDLVIWRQSDPAPVVGAHPDGELAHASVTIAPEQADEYAAQYPNGEPDCCPPYFSHRRITWNGSAFVATTLDNVATEDVPPSDL